MQIWLYPDFFGAPDVFDYVECCSGLAYSCSYAYIRTFLVLILARYLNESISFNVSRFSVTWSI